VGLALSVAERPTDDRLESCFARRGWLSTATDAHRATLLAAGRRLTLTAGHRLFAAGAPPGGIYGVVSGGIAVEGSTVWHAPRIGHVYRSGDWFGHGPALNGGNRTMGYFALEASELLTVSLAEVRALMRDDPEMTRLVGEMANRGTILASWLACDLLISDAPRRIAAVLLRVTGAHEGVSPDDPRGFLLTQADLGEMANVSRTHVNRVLGQFARSGWITKSYNHVRLVDVPALSDFAYGEP
jgi:CRP/FNR family transcriptional regulator, cyclic AMP receptor protein